MRAHLVPAFVLLAVGCAGDDGVAPLAFSVLFCAGTPCGRRLCTHRLHHGHASGTLPVVSAAAGAVLPSHQGVSRSVTGVGPQDLVAVRADITATFDRTANSLVIRRGLDIPDGGSIAPAIDFNGSEAIQAATARVTVTGLDPGAGTELVYVGLASAVTGWAELGHFWVGPTSGPTTFGTELEAEWPIRKKAGRTCGIVTNSPFRRRTELMHSAITISIGADGGTAGSMDTRRSAYPFRAGGTLRILQLAWVSRQSEIA